ncbi:LOG family protein [Lyticum sinuosum]|uniref:Cytokinin riboside 5'-monophosphate phosphoribohydrolase n=1 Tax=Lyticum sinuosum TaxID=1332059 RepID=A0AAE4VMD5_9RICK|nr:TIGR00730 family Rossman fold protein [Lyticum sinuosum]MDZ5761364.1 DNA recombination-mediator protein A family protein [Lyticum sinuosum]
MTKELNQDLTQKHKKYSKIVCVFCGSNNNVDEKYLKLGYDLGVGLAKNHLSMLYGGSNSGIMNSLAQGTIDANGKSIGVFPDKIFGRFELANPNITEMINVPDLFTRKMVMIEKSNAFVILPGGYGTLDEMFEVMNLQSIDLIKKPIIVVNYQGFWNTLIRLLLHIERERFTHRRLTEVYIVSNIDECLSKLNISFQ